MIIRYLDPQGYCYPTAEKLKKNPRPGHGCPRPHGAPKRCMQLMLTLNRRNGPKPPKPKTISPVCYPWFLSSATETFQTRMVP